MGGKPGGKGKPVCFCLAGLMVFLSSCAGVGEIQRRSQSRELLSRSASLLARGDYEGASRENLRALEMAAGRVPADEALFHLGLIYADASNPNRDYAKAADFFGRIVRNYPQSSLAEQAKVWVRVIEENGRLQQSRDKAVRENEQLSQENQKLKEVIEKSKRVDIEIEQKKRERER